MITSESTFYKMCYCGDYCKFTVYVKSDDKKS